MIITSVPVTLKAPSGPPRSPGVHVSSIIRCIATETGILKSEWVEELSLIDLGGERWWDSLDTVAMLRVAIGLAWEEWYLAHLDHVVPHPGEMCVKGIYMTHDGESLDVVYTERRESQILAIHEVKATYKSLKTVAPQHVTGNPLDPGDLESQWMWLAQLKAYCKGAGTTRGYLHPLFLCGDYKFPIRPMLGPMRTWNNETNDWDFTPSCWRIDFTQAEIDETWDTLIDYVQYLKDIGA